MLTSRESKLIAGMANRHQRRKLPYFIAEGLRVCLEAIRRRPQWIELVLVEEGYAATEQGRMFTAACAEQGLKWSLAGRDEFKSLVETETPQGVLCLLDRPAFQAPEALPSPFVLILDRVAEPGNFGTILRSAWAVGLKAIWLVKGGADPYAPKVVRSGMGAQFALEFAQFETLAAARQKLFDLGGKRLWCTEETSDVSVFDEERFDLRGSGLVIGNEANGISDTSLGEPVTIPMPGYAESLNVAQATTVFLFEAVRRHLL